MLPPKELAHSSAQLYRDVLITVLRYDDLLTPAEAVAAAEEAVNGYRSRFGPAEETEPDAGPSLASEGAAAEAEQPDDPAQAKPSRDAPPVGDERWDLWASFADPGELTDRQRDYLLARGYVAVPVKESMAEPAPWPELAEVLIAHGCEGLGREHMRYYVEVSLNEHAEQERLIESLRVYEIAEVLGMPADGLRQRLQLKTVMSCLSQLREPPFVAPAEAVESASKVELAEGNDPAVLASLGFTTHGGFLTDSEEAARAPAFPHHAPPSDADKPEKLRFPDVPQLMSGDVFDVAMQLFALLRDDGFERPDDPGDYLDYLTQVLADRRRLQAESARLARELRKEGQLFADWALNAERKAGAGLGDVAPFNRGKAWAYRRAAEAFRGLLQEIASFGETTQGEATS